MKSRTSTLMRDPKLCRKKILLEIEELDEEANFYQLIKDAEELVQSVEERIICTKVIIAQIDSRRCLERYKRNSNSILLGSNASKISIQEYAQIVESVQKQKPGDIHSATPLADNRGCYKATFPTLSTISEQVDEEGTDLRPLQNEISRESGSIYLGIKNHALYITTAFREPCALTKSKHMLSRSCEVNLDVAPNTPQVKISRTELNERMQKDACSKAKAESSATVEIRSTVTVMRKHVPVAAKIMAEETSICSRQYDHLIIKTYLLPTSLTLHYHTISPPPPPLRYFAPTLLDDFKDWMEGTCANDCPTEEKVADPSNFVRRNIIFLLLYDHVSTLSFFLVIPLFCLCRPKRHPL
ncbi:hypothetical protein Y032_0019g3827 [Ancylostoma ceylanicum]|uniref:Uncharacterized protein n=1 Tax=Ancylostoma ceylanicum TaxID=53326 RepID=A0A016V1A0_9BILA|nr:hypothetical protein Y032_0019g3827 [Ancylostoma ceylanicum]